MAGGLLLVQILMSIAYFRRPPGRGPWGDGGAADGAGGGAGAGAGPAAAPSGTNWRCGPPRRPASSPHHAASQPAAASGGPPCLWWSGVCARRSPAPRIAMFPPRWSRTSISCSNCCRHSRNGAVATSPSRSASRTAPFSEVERHRRSHRPPVRRAHRHAWRGCWGSALLCGSGGRARARPGRFPISLTAALARFARPWRCRRCARAGPRTSGRWRGV